MKKTVWKWDWNNFKKHPFLVISLVLLLIASLIPMVGYEIEEREWKKKVQAYEDAYINNKHPLDQPHEHPHKELSIE